MFKFQGLPSGNPVEWFYFRSGEAFKSPTELRNPALKILKTVKKK